jgi:23S rRNA (cytidine1920-2'-O)/16S rRNA (cytidine1409-2'-O)-methyltransferase
VALVKPQFEAGREKVGKKGVVRDPEVHLEVLKEFIINAGQAGFAVQKVSYSPIRGPEGNIEYLAYLESVLPDSNAKVTPVDLKELVLRSHENL